MLSRTPIAIFAKTLHTASSSLRRSISTRTGRLRATMQDLERSYMTSPSKRWGTFPWICATRRPKGHSKRVTAYTIALARAVGVDNDHLRIIARGAFLHDIGKIATPDAILLKPGRLDPAEMAIMREHCLRGYVWFARFPFSAEPPRSSMPTRNATMEQAIPVDLKKSRFRSEPVSSPSLTRWTR